MHIAFKDRNIIGGNGFGVVAEPVIGSVVDTSIGGASEASAATILRRRAHDNFLMIDRCANGMDGWASPGRYRN